MSINKKIYNFILSPYLLNENYYIKTKIFKIYNGVKQVITPYEDDGCYFDFFYKSNSNTFYLLNNSFHSRDNSLYLEKLDSILSNSTQTSIKNFNFNISNNSYKFISTPRINYVCNFLDKLNDLILNNDIFKSWNFTSCLYNLESKFFNKDSISNIYTKSILTLSLEFFLVDNNKHKLFKQKFLVDDSIVLDANQVFNDMLDQFHLINESFEIKNSSTNIIFKNTEFAKILFYNRNYFKLPRSDFYSSKYINYNKNFNLSFINEFREFKIIENGKFINTLTEQCYLNEAVFANLTLKNGDIDFDYLLKDFTGVLLTELDLESDISSFSFDFISAPCFGIFYEKGVRKYSKRFILKLSIKDLFSKVKYICSDLSNTFFDLFHQTISIFYSPSLLVENLQIYELTPLNFLDLDSYISL